MHISNIQSGQFLCVEPCHGLSWHESVIYIYIYRHISVKYVYGHTNVACIDIYIYFTHIVLLQTVLKTPWSLPGCCIPVEPFCKMLHLWCRHACLVFLQHGLDLEVGLEHFSEKLSPSKRKHLRKHTQHTKPTWLGMATQSRLSCFFLPLWPERGALPSKCPLKQVKVPRFLWCSAAISF